MKRNELPSREYLLDNYAYLGGELYQKTLRQQVTTLRKVGCLNPGGYTVVRIKYTLYLLNRIVYKMFTNDEPECVDHINNNPNDNRIENLQALTQSMNMLKGSNKLCRRNTSGHKGISFDKSRCKWVATIKANKTQIHLGRYENIDDAITSRRNAENYYLQNVKQ